MTIVATVYTPSDSQIVIGEATININATATQDGDSYGIYNYSYVIILAGGNVTATASAENGESVAIYTDYELDLESGSITATASSQNGDSWGICSKYNIAVMGTQTRFTASGGTSATDGMFYANMYYYDVADNQMVQVEDGKVTVDGQNLPSEVANEIWVNGVQIVGGEEPGSVQGASYDPDSNTLTLDNVTITQGYAYESSNFAGIYCDSNLNLKLVGDNTIKSNIGTGINVVGNLTIDGAGSIDVSVDGEGITVGYIAIMIRT